MTALSMEFRLTLLNVGEYLTENDVQNLAFLCEGIKPAGRELLRNARELFVELQGRDLLNERNVSVLSGWLERLNLLDALRPLREYSEKFLKNPSIPDYIQNFLVACDDGSFVPITTSARYLPDILKMEIRSSDVIVITWPKSGTTWMQYIVTQLICGKNCEDQNSTLFERNISLEFARNPMEPNNSEGGYKIAAELPPPRLLKSHLKSSMLPSSLLDSKAKVIYVVRNPKDAAVSFFNFCCMNTSLPPYKDWSEFFEHFYDGLLPYGDWFEHVLPWWEKRNEPNVLFMKYEDMKKNLQDAVLRISKFLEKSISEEELGDICEKSSFDAMKNNPYSNPDYMGIPLFTRQPIPFMRKGVIGDWRNYFTVAQNDRFDELYQRKIEGSGLELDFA